MFVGKTNYKQRRQNHLHDILKITKENGNEFVKITG